MALFDMPLTGDDLAKLINEGPAGFLEVIPEPSTFALAILGLLGLAVFRRRRGTG